jgi:uncharacterized protein (TIGR02118 family)
MWWPILLALPLAFAAPGRAATASCVAPIVLDDGWKTGDPQASGFDAVALCAVLERVAVDASNIHSVDACLYYTVDKGLAGGAPGAPATYVGMCHIFCDSVESFQAGFGPHAKEIMADIPNYTDLTPVIQISEVVVERA